MLPHEAVLDSQYKFMDAFEAEGLLGVCVCLVKVGNNSYTNHCDQHSILMFINKIYILLLDFISMVWSYK